MRMTWRAGVARVFAIEADDALFFVGWLMVVGGVGMRSVPWALVTGGALLIGAVVMGAVREAPKA